MTVPQKLVSATLKVGLTTLVDNQNLSSFNTRKEETEAMLLAISIRQDQHAGSHTPSTHIDHVLQHAMCIALERRKFASSLYYTLCA